MLACFQGDFIMGKELLIDRPIYMEQIRPFINKIAKIQKKCQG